MTVGLGVGGHPIFLPYLPEGGKNLRSTAASVLFGWPEGRVREMSVRALVRNARRFPEDPLIPSGEEGQRPCKGGDEYLEKVNAGHGQAAV